MKRKIKNSVLICLVLFKVSFKHPQWLNKDYESRSDFHQTGLLPNFANIVFVDEEMLERWVNI